MHYTRAFIMKLDINTKQFKDPENHWDVYKVMQKKYPMMNINGKRVYVHIYVAERALGRKLKPDEMVHHVDGNKNNYRGDNLVIMYRWYHALFYAQLHPWLMVGGLV
jgi:hypothetical protein